MYRGVREDKGGSKLVVVFEVAARKVICVPRNLPCRRLCWANSQRPCPETANKRLTQGGFCRVGRAARAAPRRPPPTSLCTCRWGRCRPRPSTRASPSTCPARSCSWRAAASSSARRPHRATRPPPLAPPPVARTPPPSCHSTTAPPLPEAPPPPPKSPKTGPAHSTACLLPVPRGSVTTRCRWRLSGKPGCPVPWTPWPILWTPWPVLWTPWPVPWAPWPVLWTPGGGGGRRGRSQSSQ